MSEAFKKIARAVEKWATSRPNKAAMFGRTAARKAAEQQKVEAKTPKKQPKQAAKS